MRIEHIAMYVNDIIRKEAKFNLIFFGKKSNLV